MARRPSHADGPAPIALGFAVSVALLLVGVLGHDMCVVNPVAKPLETMEEYSRDSDNATIILID
ncbi:hypothetical protein PAXRUDRAFT_831339 [Paxillus rubicundulus Ve08.2h10]|uniref:Uncharacterized protein n=1 Tax=Paxillus rubicundulus Ve08.2h10 TaxID=930991 RepID=A0A0D0D2X2_9AGAM|nr:hypothetical protein PAXRUDRAFT_831339 [Paxillus rubicundulus Ve08.2h10]